MNNIKKQTKIPNKTPIRDVLGRFTTKPSPLDNLTENLTVGMFKKPLSEVPASYAPYWRYFKEVYNYDVSLHCNDYGFYESTFEFYNENLCSNLAKTIINKKINKVLSIDSKYINASKEVLNIPNNGIKTGIINAEVTGKSLVLINEPAKTFDEIRFETIEAYRYYKTPDNTYIILTLVDKDVFKVHERQYNGKVTKLKTYYVDTHFGKKLNPSTGYVSEIHDDMLGATHFEIISNERDGVLESIKEQLLIYDYLFTQSAKEVKLTKTTIHMSDEYEMLTTTDADAVMLYDVPTINTDGKSLFQVVQPTYRGEQYFKAMKEVVKIIAQNVSMSENIINATDNSNAHSVLYEDDKTSELINTTKKHYEYVLNMLSKNYNHELTFNLGTYNKQSLEMRVNTANKMLSSIHQKVKVVHPNMNEDEIMLELYGYKIENQIPFTPIELEYYKTKKMTMPETFDTEENKANGVTSTVKTSVGDSPIGIGNTKGENENVGNV